MTRQLTRPLARRLALLGLLVLTACGSGTPAPTGPVASGALRVGLVDYEITSGAPAVTPGRLTLAVTNAGSTEHDLVVGGAGGSAQTAVLPPGGATRLTVEVDDGTELTLWCSVPGHRALGMETALPVRAREAG